MNKIEEKNALIKSTSLGYEDHGMFTGYLHLEYDGGGQGFGGYVLSGAYLDAFLQRTLKVAGVEKWEDLSGRCIRVRAEHVKVHEIGHFLKDEWFCPKKVFEEMEANAEKS